MMRKFLSFRSVGVVVAALVMVTSLAVGSSTSSAIASSARRVLANCYVQVNLPHVSPETGPNNIPGVIVKTPVQCSSAGQMAWFGKLYLCPSFPTTTKQWLNNHCVVKRSNNEESGSGNFDVGKNQRYVPPATQAGAAGTGYWIGYASWFVNGQVEEGFGPANYLSLVR